MSDMVELLSAAVGAIFMAAAFLTLGALTMWTLYHTWILMTVGAA